MPLQKVNNWEPQTISAALHNTPGTGCSVLPEVLWEHSWVCTDGITRSQQLPRILRHAGGWDGVQQLTEVFAKWTKLQLKTLQLLLNPMSWGSCPRGGAPGGEQGLAGGGCPDLALAGWSRCGPGWACTHTEVQEQMSSWLGHSQCVLLLLPFPDLVYLFHLLVARIEGKPLGYISPVPWKIGSTIPISTGNVSVLTSLLVTLCWWFVACQ